LAAAVRGFLGEVLPGPIDVVGDMEIALEAAFNTGPGVIVIAGTGSIAYGRDGTGKTIRAGGWGFAIGDEGSAHWIGRTAVNAVLRASDSSDDASVSSLAKAMFKVWGVTTLSDLTRAANSIPPPDFAALSPAVLASEDAIAGEVLLRAGRELAEIAAVVSGRLFPAGAAGVVPVAMTGGVFRHSPRVRETFYNELRPQEPRAQLIPQVVDPVEGALRMARRAAGMRM
jgi:N-acetylglucosamine kinase-like BadF-type ATPase